MGYLQFLEEGTIDLVCLAVPSLSMSRCDTIRAAAGVAEGGACNCWFDAYQGLYNAQPEVVEPSAFSTCTFDGTTPASDVDNGSLSFSVRQSDGGLLWGYCIGI